MFTKLKTYLIIGCVVLAMLGVVSFIGYKYYQATQATISTLTSDNAKLSVAVDTLNTTITNLEKHQQLANLQIQTVNTELAAARIRNRELADRLAKHDLGRLARNRSSLIEGIVNNATANALRCFELLSGAPLTEREKNAKNAREFNSECSYLFNNRIINP